MRERARLAAESSGSIGCPQGEIEIRNVSGERARYWTWEAVCRGHVYQCSKSTSSTSRCAEPPPVAPIAPAAPVAPIAPVG